MAPSAYLLVFLMRTALNFVLDLGDPPTHHPPGAGDGDSENRIVRPGDPILVRRSTMSDSRRTRNRVCPFTTAAISRDSEC